MPCQDSSFLSTLAPVGTWVVLIVGWFLVNMQNNVRTTRSEVRARIDNIIKQIQQMEQEATRYHSTDHDEIRARKIKSNIALLSIHSKFLENILSTSFAYDIFQLRNAITLKNFDSQSHQKLNPNDKMIDNIGAKTQQLITKMEEAYSSKYHQ